MIKQFLKRINFIKTIYMKLFHKQHLLMNDDINLDDVSRYQAKIIQRIKNKTKIRVAFFISTASKWKYEYLYRLLKKDNRFEVKIVVVPMHGHGQEFMIEEMLNTYNFFKDYNPIKTYDEINSQYCDIKKEFMSDVIFYSEPYNFVGSQYFISNFYKDSLCCHVQYSFMSDVFFDNFFNQPFHNLLWRFYAETKIHEKFSHHYALNKGSNVVVTGYPGIDMFIDKEYIPKNLWQKSNTKQKRLIWAPHHTITEENGTSNFLIYYQKMKDIALTYKDKLFISFKPHPNLKPRLYGLSSWGREQTDAYYKEWESMQNTQLVENDYVDLFLTSDALIHDSYSFIVEYLYTNKPSCYMYKDNDKSRWNQVGQQALEVMYKSFNESEIIDFIENVVIKGEDTMHEERVSFVENVLMPPSNKLASENILQDLIDNLITKE